MPALRLPEQKRKQAGCCMLADSATRSGSTKCQPETAGPLLCAAAAVVCRLVAEALEKKGITNVQPKDYLHFFCLGKREPMTPVGHPGAWLNMVTCQPALFLWSPHAACSQLLIFFLVRYPERCWQSLFG